VGRAGIGRGAVLLAIAALLLGCTGGGPSKKSVNESRADALYRLGARYYQDGNLRAAYSELLKAVDLEPKNAAYRNLLGLVAFSLGEYESARDQFERVLKLDPALTDAHMNLGMVYSEMEDYPRAEQEYLRTLQNPAYLTPEKVFVNWGLTLKKQGDREGAEAKFRQAIDVSPRYPRAHYELAAILEEQGDVDEALREYLEAWKSLSEVPELNLKIGELYLRLGDGAQARIYLEKVIAIAPGSTQAGRAREHLDRLDAR
jgi:type IV pilus biogenesis/stability protein PilW